MKVLVIGANGKIGSILVEKLKKAKNYEPVALVRKEEQIEKFQKEGIETVLGDLEGTIDELANLAENTEAIVFTAGSGGKTGADKTMLIDLDGAIKSMKAAEKVNIKRFIMVSGMNVDRIHETEYLSNLDNSLPYYSVAKYYADVWLTNSILEHTILRPANLTDKSGSGKIIVGERLDYNKTSRENVASTILASLDNNHTIGKSFDMTDGDTPIEEALKAL